MQESGHGRLQMEAPEGGGRRYWRGQDPGAAVEVAGRAGLKCLWRTGFQKTARRGPVRGGRVQSGPAHQGFLPILPWGLGEGREGRAGNVPGAGLEASVQAALCPTEQGHPLMVASGKGSLPSCIFSNCKTHLTQHLPPSPSWSAQLTAMQHAHTAVPPATTTIRLQILHLPQPSPLHHSLPFSPLPALTIPIPPSNSIHRTILGTSYK